MSRTAKVERNTKETQIVLELNLDGNGANSIDTGIGFFDHMLTAFSKHSGIDLKVKCTGDLVVDSHHTVEDVGIVLGQAINAALGDKKGITRYGFFEVTMDEALGKAVIDISGRAFIVFNAEFASDKCGSMDTQLFEEFFRSVAFNAGITLHVSCPYGVNDHHKAEAMFKAFARAMRMAVAIDERFSDQVISTKGVL